MKVLLDTNIILDDALEREPFWDASEQVLSLIEQGQIEGYISASTVSDLYYIIRKARGRDWALTYRTYATGTLIFWHKSQGSRVKGQKLRFFGLLTVDP